MHKKILGTIISGSLVEGFIMRIVADKKSMKKIVLLIILFSTCMLSRLSASAPKKNSVRAKRSSSEVAAAAQSEKDDRPAKQSRAASFVSSCQSSSAAPALAEDKGNFNKKTIQLLDALPEELQNHVWQFLADTIKLRVFRSRCYPIDLPPLQANESIFVYRGSDIQNGFHGRYLIQISTCTSLHQEAYEQGMVAIQEEKS